MRACDICLTKQAPRVNAVATHSVIVTRLQTKEQAIFDICPQCMEVATIDNCIEKLDSR